MDLNLKGKKFNRLTVIERQGTNNHKNSLWLCECECGVRKVIVGYRINKGAIKSCGCLATEARRRVGKNSVKNLIGQRFCRLTVVSRKGTNNAGNVIWTCLCDCGKETDVAAGDLRKATKSCGCLRIDRAVNELSKINTTHGLTHTKEYKRHKGNQRRAQELKAVPKWANKKKILEIYKNCPDGYHVDHIVPLLGKTVCGFHVENNLQYLTVEENLKKSNKLL